MSGFDQRYVYVLKGVYGICYYVTSSPGELVPIWISDAEYADFLKAQKDKRTRQWKSWQKRLKALREKGEADGREYERDAPRWDAWGWA